MSIKEIIVTIPRKNSGSTSAVSTDSPAFFIFAHEVHKDTFSESVRRILPIGDDRYHLFRERVLSLDVYKRQTNTFRPALDYLGIVLETDIPKDLPHLELDQTKIRQALFNLLRNAQEAIQHAHGKIQIAASAVSDGIQITVHDNGCGMTAQQTEQIFFPFVTYKPGGTGLGLAVTRQIIEAHHGTLRVESVPCEGTSFYILLPLG